MSCSHKNCDILTQTQQIYWLIYIFIKELYSPSFVVRIFLLLIFIDALPCLVIGEVATLLFRNEIAYD